MTDQVEYLLKGGWLGALASGLVMPLIFAAMFHARHKATRDWFNCNAPAKAPRED
jgi:ligand-binding SRPBCC domain-containing protein